MKPIKHDMRTYRRQFSFTQQEIAEIIGLLDTSQICRIETSSVHPQIQLAILYDLLFHAQLYDLFPNQYKQLRATLATRIPQIIDSYVCNEYDEQANLKIGILQKLIANLNQPSKL